MVLRTARTVVVALIGGTVVLVGIVLIVLPGPAFLVIPAGLAILATEFAWARYLLKKLKQQASNLTGYGDSKLKAESELNKHGGQPN